MSSDQWYQCYPELGNRSCSVPIPDQSYYIYVAVLYTFSICSGILNLMVIIAISHFRQLHSSVNFILLNLAVSDFLVCCVLIPVMCLFPYSCWRVGDIMCVLFLIFHSTVLCASIGDMVLISIDRYVAICDPMHYSTWMCRRSVSIGLISCWVFTVLGGFGSYYNCVIDPTIYKMCEGGCFVDISHFGLYFDLAVNFCGSLTVIIILYLRVFFVAVSQARAMRSQVAAPTQQPAVNSRKSELKAARSLGFVVLLFLLCSTPAYAANLVLTINLYLYMFLHNLILLNACFNPILYALQYPWFRRSVKLIVTFRIFQSGSSDANVLY